LPLNRLQIPQLLPPKAAVPTKKYEDKMEKRYLRSAALSICLLSAAGLCAAQRELDFGAIAPITAPGDLSNEVYIGFEHTRFDYEVLSKSGPNSLVASNGVNAQIAFRSQGHLMYLGTARYGTGAALSQHMLTLGAGAGYVLPWRRYEPFGQVMLGYSRLSSPYGMYLSQTVGGVTTMVGAGLDVKINEHWGIRPVYAENQYLPSFGSKGSILWNVGGGAVYRFNGFTNPLHFHRRQLGDDL
jgi:hypothetical protein